MTKTEKIIKSMANIFFFSKIFPFPVLPGAILKEL